MYAADAWLRIYDAPTDAAIGKYVATIPHVLHEDITCLVQNLDIPRAGWGRAAHGGAAGQGGAGQGRAGQSRTGRRQIGSPRRRPSLLPSRASKTMP